MGKHNQEKVQLVISHLEGCSGNFLARLFVADKPQTNMFRIDVDLHPLVLSTDGCKNWEYELKRLENHTVVVTHNFDQTTIRHAFPNARILAIYPYTHVGNVLYNICFKKLVNTIPNQVDNYLIHLKEWYTYICQRYPDYQCINFWDLSDQNLIEQIFESKLTPDQQHFFNQYWKKQLKLNLNIPSTPQSIDQLITGWNIQDQFNDWLVAWTIFVYELINCKTEQQRLWSIDADTFRNWSDLKVIQNKYNHNVSNSN
jgi:hypothetical protein